MNEFFHIPTIAKYPTPPISSGVRSGQLVFVSGTPGFHSDGTLDSAFATQFALAIEELTRVLEAAGGRLCDLVKVNVLLTRTDDLLEMNSLYASALGPAPFPARTTAIVAALPHPLMLLEIEAIAVLYDAGAAT